MNLQFNSFPSDSSWGHGQPKKIKKRNCFTFHFTWPDFNVPTKRVTSAAGSFDFFFKSQGGKKKHVSNEQIESVGLDPKRSLSVSNFPAICPIRIERIQTSPTGGTCLKNLKTKRKRRATGCRVKTAHRRARSDLNRTTTGPQGGSTCSPFSGRIHLNNFIATSTAHGSNSNCHLSPFHFLKFHFLKIY